MTPKERNLADIGLIALRHGLTRHDILGWSRKDHIVKARQHCFRHFRQKTVNGRIMSYPEIGRLFGRHHSTVIYGVSQYVDRNAPLSPLSGYSAGLI